MEHKIPKNKTKRRLRPQPAAKPRNRLLAFAMLFLAFLLTMSATAQDPYFSTTISQNGELMIGQTDWTGNSGGCTNQLLDQPYGIAIDAEHGKMYVADYGNHRVLRFNYPLTGSKPVADLVFGQPDFTSNTVNNGGLSASCLFQPVSVAVDASGNLWVSDLGNKRILRYPNAWTTSSNKPNADVVLGVANFTTAGILPCAQITFDDAGNLWVAGGEAHQVYKYAPAQQVSGTVSATTRFGLHGSVSGTAQDALNTPAGVCMIGTSLFVADYYNHRVLRFDDAANLPDYANASQCIGQPDYATNTSGTAQNKFKNPYFLTTDGKGNLYVSDYANSRVLVFNNAINLPGYNAKASSVLGQPDFTTGTAATAQNGLNRPTGIAFDPLYNKLFVSDIVNQRVVQYASQDNALAFDGVDDYVSIPGTWGGSSLTELTIEGWINTNNPETFQHILSSNAPEEFVHFQVGGNTLGVAVYADNGYFPITGTATLPQNEWVHVALVVKSGDSRLYINGVLDKTVTNTFSYINSTSDLTIGKYINERFFNGSMDELSIWNVALSETEINTAMQSPLKGTESGLLAYYDFNNGNAGKDNTGLTTLYDKTQNGNNGTLTNFALSGSTSNYAETGASIKPEFVSAVTTQTDLTINWNCGGAPDNYLLTVSTDPFLRSAISGYDKLDIGSETSYTVSGLSKGQTYYFNVWAVKDGTQSNPMGIQKAVTKSYEVAGNALSFDGTDDYVNCGNNASLNFTTAFTLEAWINPVSITSEMDIIDKRNDVAVAGGYSFFVRSGGNLSITLHNKSVYNSTVSCVTANEWQHVAVVWDGNDKATFYRNGVLIETITGSIAGINSSPTSIFCVGKRYTNINYFSGMIDEVRAWNRARSGKEIRQTMDKALAGNESGLVGYWNFDEGEGTVVLDKTSNENHGTYAATRFASGADVSTPGNALKFDGTGDYVDLGNIVNHNTFTISMWVKPGATQVEYADILDNMHASNINWVVQQNGTTTNQYGFVGTTFDLPSDQWSHVALVCNNLGATTQAYVNGSLVSSGSLPFTYDGNQHLRIGKFGYGGRNWNGSIDELSFWDRALNETEIQSNMDNSLVGNESGLIAYYNFNETEGTTVNDLTANANNGEFQIHGNRSTSSAPLRPADIRIPGIVTFDGVNDYISVANPGDDRLLAQSFSVALWVKPAAEQVMYADIMDANHVIGGNWVIQQNGNSTNTYYFSTYENGAWHKTDNFNLPADEWSFLVVTRDGDNYQKKVYINGVLETTKTGVGDIEFNEISLALGHVEYGGRNWKGSMDEFGFYSRTLTLSEIKALYMSHQQYDGNCQSIYIPFDEDAGFTCTDYSANDYPAVMVGNVERGTASTPVDTGMVVPGVFKASKGYYNTKVALEWRVDNAWRNIIHKWYVYRKPFGSSDSSLIYSSAEGDNVVLFNDENCDGGVLYEYIIIGETDFGGCLIYTNPVYQIGYRSPTGVVNGRVSFEGGTAVENVRVIAERSEGSTGKSAYFSGNDYAKVLHDEKLMPTDGITCELFINPDNLDTDLTFMQKEGSYKMYYTSGDQSLNFDVTTENGTFTTSAAGILSVNVFKQITGTYNGSEVQLYINGEPQTPVEATGMIAESETDLIVGTNYTGYLDEIRLWNYGKDSAQVNRDYFRILGGNENGCVAYWRIDEGVAQWSFDQAHEGVTYYANDMTFYGVEWSDVIPNSQQLGLCGITNENGDYTIVNIGYRGTGETFTLTPFLNIHQFEPGQKGVFIGDGSIVLNNQDFIDVSSFKVTGTVKYKDCDCYAKGIYVEIDGSVAVENGKMVETDANGYFEVDVPIGYHYISLMGINHTFEVGQWPTDSTLHDFQAPISGIEFIDNTTRTVAGRVVGGTREGNKKLGFGESVNNIGQATITFKSEQGNGCFTQTIQTDPQTGEYVVEIPPLRYIIDELEIPSNLAIDFGTLDILDLTQILPPQTSYDTVYVEENGEPTDVIDHVNEFRYHLNNSYIYRVPPEMDVTLMDGSPIAGETELKYKYKTTGEEITIDLLSNPLPYPVFRQAGTYDFKITAFEPYFNKDADYADDGEINESAEWTEDQVPVNDGKILVTNNFAAVLETEADLTNGEYKYRFIGNNPNIAVNTVTPEWSFTRTMSVNLETDDFAITWPSDEPFRAFLLGARASGSNFVTEGPQIVDFVLRDPPGDGSSTSLAKGSTLAFDFNMKHTFAYDSEYGVSLGAGLDMTMGFGVMTRQAVKGTVSNKWNVHIGASVGGGVKQSFSNQETFSTSSSPDFVGADGDLFVGKSMNFNYGNAINLKVLPKQFCVDNDIDHLENVNIDGLTLGIYPGMYVVPDGYSTMFIYSQKHIVEDLIPNLEYLRDNLFINQPDRYVSKVAADDERFGTNNDDAVWGSAATLQPEVDNIEDDNGPSYTYYRPSRPSPVPDDYVEPQDSIRWYNQQIRLWKEAIAANEYTKQVAEKEKNISFDGGASYSSSHTETTAWQVSTSFNISLAYTIGAKITSEGAFNFEGVMSHKFTMGSEFAFTASGSESQTYSYSLADGNSNDYFSVDVKTLGNAQIGLINSILGEQVFLPGSPIFYTQAGQSKCPYEGETRSLYYKPGQVILGNATMSRGVPSIEVVSAPIVNNVPENNEAEFTLLISNYSETGEDASFTLKVDEVSNPYGAVVYMDGALMNNRSISVPGNSSVQKVITVAKGPSEFDYEDIRIKVSSDCGDFGDDAYISAHFIPGCSDVTLLKPDEIWTANTDNENILPVVISDYDVNKDGLENIKIQYKPTSSSQWVNLKTFYKEYDENFPDRELIPDVQTYIQYNWDISQIIDANYNLRAVTTCALGESYSQTLTGIVDRVSPHPFGSPQPADGVLTSGDEISVRFNELLNAGMINRGNFDVRGVLNGTQFDHNASLYFDGAEDNMRIPSGINLSGKAFTVEFWAKRATDNQECFISQGTTQAQGLWIGFDAENKFSAKLAGHSITTAAAYPKDDTWHHYAFVYNNVSGWAALYIDGDKVKEETFMADYQGNGIIYAGQSNFGDPQYYTGNMHELRIWYKQRLQTDLVANFYTVMTGNEVGLTACYPMNEAFGEYTTDKVRSRNALVNAQWVVEPNGKAVAFDGANQAVEIPGAMLAFTPEQNFTIEFWFKTETAQDACLFSNGKGDVEQPNGWSIQTTADGKIQVLNNGILFNAIEREYYDGKWHHFAMTVNRLGNTHAFFDGEVQNSIESKDFKYFGGPKIFIAARGWYDGDNPTTDMYFNGSLDEVRVWNCIRKSEQIRRFMSSRLAGDEVGIVAYYPFETYEEMAGVPLLTESFVNIINPDETAAPLNGAAYTDACPAIKLAQPYSKVNFNYSVNEDLIMFALDDPAELLENCILDFAVEGMNDMNGNVQKSPAVWSALIRMNQVRWQEQELKIDKKLYEPQTITVKIENLGGSQQSFDIYNLPAWLSVSPASGVIDPLSEKEITFTISEGANTGYYAQDIYLHSDFGFDEKLALNLRVFAEEPDWTVDPADYQYSLNIIGQIQIEGVISNDVYDKVAAFVDGECRGVANLRYIESLDMYEAFLDVYSNEAAGETITLLVWDASMGEVKTNVTPSYTFQQNEFFGSPVTPEMFTATGEKLQSTPLKSGWNWVSINVLNNDMTTGNIMSEVSATSGDMVKTREAYDQYDPTAGWVGTLGTLNNREMYMVELFRKDTIEFSGMRLDPANETINLTTGWNWIGYTPSNNLLTEMAMSNFDALTGDIVKAQNAFAIYTEGLGWIGTLQYMKPGEGYMMKSAEAKSFVYPSYNFKSGFEPTGEVPLAYRTWEIAPEQYEYTMSVVAEIVSNGKLAQSASDGLAVYAGNECRAVALPIEVENRLLYFITVFSNNPSGELLNFKYFNVTENKEIQAITQMQFIRDNVSGDVLNPFVINLTTDATGLGADSKDGNSMLLQTHPNPFGVSTEIMFNVSGNENVKVEIFDILGKRVTTLFEAKQFSGSKSITWNSNDANGNIVSKGIYFVKMRYGADCKTVKLVKVH